MRSGQCNGYKTRGQQEHVSNTSALEFPKRCTGCFFQKKRSSFFEKNLYTGKNGHLYIVFQRDMWFAIKIGSSQYGCYMVTMCARTLASPGQWIVCVCVSKQEKIARNQNNVWASTQAIFLYSTFSFDLNIRKLFGTQPKQFSYIQLLVFTGI